MLVGYKAIADNYQKAIDEGENSGHHIDDDFAEVSKIVDAGISSKPVIDYELSRYACYLIVQNGDPRKEAIALGQTYFAINPSNSRCLINNKNLCIQNLLQSTEF